MAVSSRAEERPPAIGIALLRAAVAALVLLHVVLVAGQLETAGLLPVAIGASALLVASGVAGFMSRRFVPLAIADLAALLVIARVTIDIDPTASIVWSFLLWVPFSVAMRAGASGAALATGATVVGVLAANLVHVGALEPVPARWTTIAVPALLALVGGSAMLAAILLQQRTAEAVQRRLLDEQRRSSRLREADELKNTFLAAVSHELRSPLTSILGFSLTLLDRHDLEPAQRERMLRTIVLEAEHLEDILANLLDLDRLTRGKATLVPVELDPARVIGTAVEHVRRRSGRSIELELEEGVRAWLDAAKVERIVENLAGNAVKYTPAGAEIRVLMGRDRHGIRIRVEDSGPGIGSELRESIFEPFRRGTEHGVPGTGIGLSLVDQFSRMHGGRAWLEERPGGGCRFHVYLPSARRPLDHGARDGGSRPAEAHQHAGLVAGDGAGAT